MKVARTVWSGGKTREGSTYHYSVYQDLVTKARAEGIEQGIELGRKTPSVNPSLIIRTGDFEKNSGKS